MFRMGVLVPLLPLDTYMARYREKFTVYTIHWLVAWIKRWDTYCAVRTVYLNASQVKVSTFPPLEHWNVDHTVKV